MRLTWYFKVRQRLVLIASQSIAGLVIGGSAWLVAQVIFLPFLDASGLVVLLMASCSVGLFWGFSRPVLSIKRLAGVVAVFAALLALMIKGTPVIMKWLESGRSSDFNDLAGGLAFIALCTAPAAPLSAFFVSRNENEKAET